MGDSPENETTTVTTVPPRLFWALGSEECRHVLAVLSETGDRLECDDLVEAVFRRVNRRSPRELRVRLTHLHLPALADDGLLEWEPESRTVVATEASADLLAAVE